MTGVYSGERPNFTPEEIVNQYFAMALLRKEARLKPDQEVRIQPWLAAITATAYRTVSPADASLAILKGPLAGFEEMQEGFPVDPEIILLAERPYQLQGLAETFGSRLTEMSRRQIPWQPRR